jgi:hypothetical protein
MENTATLSEDRKKEIEAASRKKLLFMQSEYWRVRNGKQRFLRCPYCATGNIKRRNFFGAPKFCCDTFARALKAILDRQDEVDRAAEAARRACALMNMANKIDQSRAN